MHVVLFRRLEEVHRPVNVAVIGDCDRLLSDARNALDELFHVACAVQQRIVGMQMQMSKFRHVCFYFRWSVNGGLCGDGEENRVQIFRTGCHACTMLRTRRFLWTA